MFLRTKTDLGTYEVRMVNTDTTYTKYRIEFDLYGRDTGDHVATLSPCDHLTFDFKTANIYAAQALKHARENGGVWPNFQEFWPTEYDFENDPRVLAVRNDPKIGRGTCSPTDECWDDWEICCDLDATGKTVEDFIRDQRSVMEVFEERAADAKYNSYGGW